MNPRYSMRQRLLRWISIPAIAATVLALLISFVFAWHEIDEVYDAQLVHSAKVLLQLTQHEMLEDGEFNLGTENPDLHHPYERRLGFRIWVEGKLVTQSPNTKADISYEAPEGFSNKKIGKHVWRFFTFLEQTHNIKIEVSESYHIRYELIIQLICSLVFPMLILGPAVFAIIWVGVRKVLQPIIKASADVDRRSSDDLSPIDDSGLPEEVVPLIQALNRLFIRLHQSFRREREFTDHAAHELRTPLAAMKTQTQVLFKKTSGQSEYAEGFKNLEASINRAAHMVEQLLSLARLQNESLPLEDTDFSACVLACAQEAYDRAEKKNITLTKSIAAGVRVAAQEDSLKIMLGNLLDNAIKYTPAGGQISLTLDEQAVLEIADSGPGIPDADKERVFERFVRVDKTGQSGSGLGLSISKWVAQAHGAVLTLSDNVPQGLIVRLAMPRP